MVKERGPADCSLFTTFRRQLGNTNLVNTDRSTRVMASSRISPISKNASVDTIPNYGVNRFVSRFVDPPVVAPEEAMSATSNGQLAFDAAGNLFIADRVNSRVRRVDAVTGAVTTFVGTGGEIDSALSEPRGLAFDAAGNLFISESTGHRVRRVDAVTRAITTFAGTGTSGNGGDGGLATAATIAGPWGLAFDTVGNLFIATPGGNRVRRVDAVMGIISRFAGVGAPINGGDGGLAINAAIHAPYGLAFDDSGNLFITAVAGIRRVNSGGIITTVTGTTGTGQIMNVAYRPGGFLYWSRFYASSPFVYNVFKINLATNLVETVAGTGVNGTLGDGGPATAAQLNDPAGVAFDSAGNLFIGSNASGQVRRVDAISGIITTVPGT